MKNIIYMLLLAPIFFFGQTKAQRVTQFDSYWYNPTTNSTYSSKASVINEVTNREQIQGMYYGAWGVNGCLNALRATGDTKYLNDLYDIFVEMRDEANFVPIGNGTTYKGWPSTKTGQETTKGLPLWESYMWRFYASLLRIMYQSPTLRATSNGSYSGSTYQTQYDEMLAFIQLHIWEKWKTNSISSLYRSRTHMASHWARIAQELHIITGDAEYLTVFDDITWDGMSNYSNQAIRDRIYNLNSTTYSMYQEWVNNTVQDTEHGADIMSYVVNGYEAGYYWTSEDLGKFTNMLNNVIWTGSGFSYKQYFDGSGGSAYTHSYQFISLARHNTALFNRFNAVTWPNITGAVFAEGAGEMLLAKAYQEGTVQLPETESTDPPDPDSTAPVVTSYEIQNLTTTSAKLRWYIDEGSKGNVLYGTASDATPPYTYTYSTVREESYPLTHGQTMGAGLNPPPLTPNTTYYFRTYQEDIHGNIGYSAENSFTTLSDGTPIITLTGSEVVNLEIGETYTELGATWDDGTSSGAATVGGDTVDGDTVGTYMVSYSHAGATTIYRTVIVSNPPPDLKGEGYNFHILISIQIQN